MRAVPPLLKVTSVATDHTDKLREYRTKLDDVKEYL